MNTAVHIASRDDPGIVPLAVLLTTGGILTGLCYLYLQAYLAWVCLMPLLYILEKTPKLSFFYGIYFGCVAGAILYHWVIPVSVKYSGHFTAFSIAFYLLAIVYTALYYGAFCVGYAVIRAHVSRAVPRGVAAAALFTLLEYLKIGLFPGLPWLKYNLALSQSPSMEGIQLASVGGLYCIIFIIVVANYAAARCLAMKDYRGLIVPVMIAVCYYALGRVLIERQGSTTGSIKICMVTENTPAELKWNDQSGDSLVRVLFELSDRAAASHPELIVWTETPVPWKFSLDDPFLKQVLNITYRSRADHLIGMFSPAATVGDEMYNSVFLIKYDGRITERYDKNTLLSFLEEPIVRHSSLQLPLLNASAYTNIIPGQAHAVMTVGKAKIGVLICNEILTAFTIPEYGDNSNLLVLMSNDAWFESTPVTAQHFYAARLHAVMAGKPVVVNSNRGMCGLITWNGKILHSQCSEKAETLRIEPELGGANTIYASIEGYDIVAYVLLFAIPFAGRRKR